MASKDFLRSYQRYPVLWEIAFSVFCLFLLIYFFWPLIIGARTLPKDSFYWGYPIFQFFAESLIGGSVPLWNPFTHAGEPLYPILGQLRLLEPLTILNILIGRLLTDDAVALFNWDRIIQSLLTILGMYLVLRPFAKEWMVRFSLILILFFSSILIGHFEQSEILSQFIWVPYIVWILNRIVFAQDYRFHHWMLLAVFTGLKCQSHFFSGIAVYFLFFSVGLLLFHRADLKALFRLRSNWLKLLITLAVVFLTFSPNLVLLTEQGRFVFPMEMVDKARVEHSLLGHPDPAEAGPSHIVEGVRKPYSMIRYSGSFSSIWDFIQMIVPDGNPNVHIPFACHGRWGAASQAYIYLGIMTWAIALVGMFLGQNTYKRLNLLLLGGFGLLMLGPIGALHPLLYGVFPPLWFLRQTQALVLFFDFSLLYFFLLGCRWLLDRWRSERPRRAKAISWVAGAVFFVTAVFAVFGMASLEFPNNRWTVVWVLFTIATGWLLRKKLSRATLCGLLMLGQITVVLYLHPLAYSYWTYLLWTLGLPVFFIFLLLDGKTRTESDRMILPALGLAFLVILGCDLIYGFRQAASLYRGQPPPSEAVGVSTQLVRPVPPEPRLIQEPYAPFPSAEPIRYLSLLIRKSTVFSPVLVYEGKRLSFDQAISGGRWATFLMLRNYFELIHSGLPPAVVKELFAVEQAPFQLKRGVIPIENGNLFSPLIELGADDAVTALRANALIDPQQFSGPHETSLKSAKFPTSHTEMFNFAYRILSYQYGAIELRSTSREPGIFLWVDGYDPNWEGTIDGRRVPVYLANGNFKAVALPAGEHHIRFEYKPIKFIRALKVSYGALIAWLLLAAALMIRSLSGKSHSRGSKN